MAAYEADRSLRGKLRRRYSRLFHRRPLTLPEGRP
ncbi:MAG: polysaccharide deacetylase, partial [Caulobacteraceae bacterium]|nr:polysaccharide deacetylase [Caulobacteraceae bacterium]